MEIIVVAVGSLQTKYCHVMECDYRWGLDW
jgi:hypothetical protein